MSEEIKKDDEQTLNSINKMEKNLYYCWLCGEETLGLDVCPVCGIPQ